MVVVPPSTPPRPTNNESAAGKRHCKPGHIHLNKRIRCVDQASQAGKGRKSSQQTFRVVVGADRDPLGQCVSSEGQAPSGNNNGGGVVCVSQAGAGR